MATCAEIRAQLDPLFKEWCDLTNEVLSDQGDVKELESEASHVNPDILARARAKLTADEEKLKQIEQQISPLREAVEAQGCLMQPQEILEIQFSNPTDVKDVDALFAQAVALGQPDPSTILGGTFPSRDAQQEWKQVLPADLTATDAHNEDYEGLNLVGATGWALNPEFSGGDVPFDHPFEFDWEFMLALDQPAGDTKRYTFLLTPGDQSCDEEGFDEALQQAIAFKDSQGNSIIPQGADGLPSLLGVEIDGGLVPRQFSDECQGGVVQGDRVAVFGRWIVDCGHQVPITLCDENHTDIHTGLKVFRTEIHPPLLMAAARVTTSSQSAPEALASREVTRVLFTSRPYLVGQRFTTDTATVYDDAHEDDGPFFPHMIKEVVKVNETLGGIPLGSLQVEAHPKIKSFPFQGFHEFHLTVRPPSPDLGAAGVAAQGPVAVAFQFTVRSGCWVQVTPNGTDAIDVVIRLNQDGYTPPPLPQRSERTWTQDELGKLNQDAATAFLEGEALSAAIHLATGNIIGAGIVTAILQQGVLTDEYDTKELVALNLLDASHALSAPASNIPNTDIQAQLAALQVERDQLASVVQSDQDDLKELQSESSHINPVLLKKAQAKLNADEAQLKQIDGQIAALKNAPAQGVLLNDNQPYPVYGWLEVGFTAP